MLFNKCLNEKKKFYAFCTLGAVIAFIIAIIVWIIFSMPIGLLALFPGYMLGRLVGDCWFKGKIQKFMYKHFPIAKLLGGNKMPPSYIKRYR